MEQKKIQTPNLIDFGKAMHIFSENIKNVHYAGRLSKIGTQSTVRTQHYAESIF